VSLDVILSEVGRIATGASADLDPAALKRDKDLLDGLDQEATDAKVPFFGKGEHKKKVDEIHKRIVAAKAKIDIAIGEARARIERDRIAADLAEMKRLKREQTLFDSIVLSPNAFEPIVTLNRRDDLEDSLDQGPTFEMGLGY